MAKKGTSPGHGGPRPGSGRKRLADPIAPYTVHISQDQVRLLREWGAGDLSAGLRWLVEVSALLVCRHRGDMMMRVKQVIDLRPGTLYQFVGIMGPKDDHGNERWMFPPATYRLIGVASDVHTHQQRVVYQGVGQPDDGLLKVCGLAEWGKLFVTMEPVLEAAPPEIPEKVADHWAHGGQF